MTEPKKPSTPRRQKVDPAAQDAKHQAELEAARKRAERRRQARHKQGEVKRKETLKAAGKKRGSAPDLELRAKRTAYQAPKKSEAELQQEAIEKFLKEQEKELTPEQVKIRDANTRRNAMQRAANSAATKEAKKEQQIDKKDAVQRELAERTMARRRLLQYIRKFQPGYQAGWVHMDICRRLERFLDQVAAGESPRLMLCMPPRHGKSLIASSHFPAFALGHYPHFEIIAASYAVSLPLGFSRKVRARVRDDKVYQAMFPETRLNMEAQSAEGWETTKGGGYVPAGVGGSITGKGAHILIIDDPVKDAQDADSDQVRETTWDWWGATAKTRLAPGGGVLVIQTRWHDDDLAGRLLQQKEDLRKEAADMRREGLLMMQDQAEDSKLYIEGAEFVKQADELLTELDDWELVNYPAIAEQDEYLHKDTYEVMDHPVIGKTKLLRKKGDALHPARFPRARLMNMKRTMQPRHWSALYQQNPVPDEGLYFTKADFRYRASLNFAPRENEVRLMAVDLAITDKQVNDRTSIAVGVYSWDRTVTVPEIVRGRWTTYQIVDAICNAIQRWDVEILGIENGQLKHAIMPILLDELSERNITVAFDDDLTPITDKSARNRTLQGMMQQGRWHYIHNDTWFPPVQQQMLRFPGGINDDDVDSQGWLARMVSKISPPSRPTSTLEENSWKKRLAGYAAEQRASSNNYMGA